MSFYCALILYIQDAIMKKDTLRCLRIMKAVDGFEPTIKLLQSRALPLGYTAITDTILSKKQRFVKSLSSNWLVDYSNCLFTRNIKRLKDIQPLYINYNC